MAAIDTVNGFAKANLGEALGDTIGGDVPGLDRSITYFGGVILDYNATPQQRKKQRTIWRWITLSNGRMRTRRMAPF